MKIGNGIKLTFCGRLVITGKSSAITDTYTAFNKTSFPSLNFIIDENTLFSFDEDTGIFEFFYHGILSISASINFSTPAQPTKFEVVPCLDSGSGFVELFGRTSSINTLVSDQIVLVGNIAINKGYKLKFDIRNSTNSAFFDTEILSNGAIVPAAIVDF